MSEHPLKIIFQLSIGIFALIGSSLTWALSLHNASGIECNAVNPSQAKKIEWRQEGIINKSKTGNVWVTCPLTRLGESVGTGDLFSVRVAAFNLEDGVLLQAPVRCELKEMVGKNRIESRIFKTTVAPGEQKTMQVCDRTPDTWETTYFISCRLAPKTGISTLTTQTRLSSETGVFCS